MEATDAFVVASGVHILKYFTGAIESTIILFVVLGWYFKGVFMS